MFEVERNITASLMQSRDTRRATGSTHLASEHMRRSPSARPGLSSKEVNMNRQIKASLLAVLLISLNLPAAARTVTASPAPDKPASAKQAAFQDAMRKLWEDHITWTRVFIISAVADSPDKAAATERLLQNQVDIGNAIKPYYGDAAGDKLTTLL